MYDIQAIAGQRLSLLRMAKEILLNEHAEKKAEIHNRWSAEAAIAWRTRGMVVPYPIFPPYPDNSMIVYKAIELAKSLNNNVTPEVPLVREEPIIEPIIQEPVTTESITEETVVEEPKENLKSIIFDLLEKNENFKNEEETKELLSDIPSLLPKDN